MFGAPQNRSGHAGPGGGAAGGDQVLDGEAEGVDEDAAGLTWPGNGVFPSSRAGIRAGFLGIFLEHAFVGRDPMSGGVGGGT